MSRTIGIMGAMPEEISGVIELLSSPLEYSTGRRTYYFGFINGIKVVVVFSRWGKVAAAATAATLIHKFSITDLLFTGVAGAIHPSLKTGDIVVAERLIQHDLDARPLIRQFEVPLLNRDYLHADDKLSEVAVDAITQIIQNDDLNKKIQTSDPQKCDLLNPKLYIGAIASGDQFFYKPSQKHELQKLLPEVLCVEMEGAAVAQVCFESSIPFAVIRTISDDAGEKAPVNFPVFVEQIASIYSTEIIQQIFKLI